MWQFKFSIYAIPPLLTAFILLIIGILAWRKSHFKKAKITFGLFCLSMIVWLLGFSAMYLSPNERLALQRARIGFLGIIFIPILAYHFILSFIHSKRKFLLKLLYLSTLPQLILSQTNYVYNGIATYFWGYYPTAGSLYFAFMGIFSSVFTWGVILLFQELRNSKRKQEPIRTQQIKYVLLAFACGTTGVIDYLVKYRIEIYPYGYISALGFISLIGYAIAKYRLMDIRLIFRGGLVFLSYLAIMATPTITLLILSKNTSPIIITLFILIIVSTPFVYQYLRNRSLTIIDFLFFKGKFDYQKKLAEISDTITSILDSDKLLHYVVTTIAENMRIKKCLIFLKDDYGDYYKVAQHTGLDNSLASKRIDVNTSIIQWIKTHKDAQVKYELYQSLPFEEAQKVWAELIPFESEVVVPLHKGESLVGMISLANKSGGNIFTNEDFRILQAIANQLAVIIENIKLYDRIIHTDRQTFLETLASGVSHEMRNRLVAIRTFIELFPDRVDMKHVDPDYIEFKKLADSEMVRLVKIIDGLLTYSRASVEGGADLDISESLDESLMIIQPHITKKLINLNKQLAPNLPHLIGDKGRLLQVFINIINNAIDAMDQGGKLTITSRDINGDIEVNISDSGKGIAKEHIPYIFEPFFTTKTKGTGLGLSIVNRIVKDHGGTIKVESEIGKGTTFIIIFPKGSKYKPIGMEAKEGLRYWQVKTEYKEEKKPKDENNKENI